MLKVHKEKKNCKQKTFDDIKKKNSKDLRKKTDENQGKKWTLITTSAKYSLAWNQRLRNERKEDSPTKPQDDCISTS